MDKLQGINATQQDLVDAIEKLISIGNVKQTVEVNDKGIDKVTKKVEKFDNAWAKLQNGKNGDKYIEKLDKLHNLLTVKFKNVNLNQFTSQLTKALTDPTKSAEELTSTIDSVYESISTLSKISNSGKFEFVTEADIRRLIKDQQRVDEALQKHNEALEQARNKANSGKQVSISKAANKRDIGKTQHTQIAEQLGIKDTAVDLKQNDDQLLQNYKQAADLLAKMISERKEFNNLNGKNSEEYAKQEKDILSVYQQLMNIEKDVSEKFSIDPSKLLSNQFKNNGRFDFVDNANKAVRAYVQQMTTGTAKALERARATLNQDIEKATSKSVGRVESVQKKISKATTGKTDGTQSDAGAEVGKEVGGAIADGMDSAKKATEDATSSIQKYILTAEETINKLNELKTEIEDLDTIVNDTDDPKAIKQLDEKYGEAAKYVANLKRLGYSDKKIDSVLGKDIYDQYWRESIDTMAPENTKEITDAIKKYVGDTPIEAKIEPVVENKEEVEQINQLGEHEIVVQVKLDDIKTAMSEIDKLQKKSDKELGVLFDSTTGKAGSIFEGKDSRQISAKQLGTELFNYRKSNGQFPDTIYHTHPDSQVASFSQSDIQTAIDNVKKGITYIVAQAGNEIAQINVKQLVESGVDVDKLMQSRKDYAQLEERKIIDQKFSQLKYSDLLGKDSNWEKNIRDSLSNFLSEDFGFVNGQDLHFTDEIKTTIQSYIDNIIASLKQKAQDGQNLRSSDFSEIGREFEDQTRERLVEQIAQSGQSIDTSYIGSIFNDICGYIEEAFSKTDVYKDAIKLSVDESQLASQKALQLALSDQVKNPESVYKISSKEDYVKSIYSPTQDEKLELKGDGIKDYKQQVADLKEQVASLLAELQKIKESNMDPQSIVDLQNRLKEAEQNARALREELSYTNETSIDLNEYNKLEEELQQAKDNVIELEQQLKELQDVESQHATTPTTSVLSAKDFYSKFGTPSQALDSSSFGGDYDALFSYLGDKFKELRKNATSFSEQQLDFEFLKELVSQLDLSDEKLKVIQADFERISERLPGGNAAFEPEEMKTEEIASRLKDIVAIIDGTKIISPEDLSNAESILRYAKEYRQEMSKPSGTIQEQREELQQVDTSSAQESEQADIQAAEAAEQRAQANEHLAESEQKVDEAESANNGTPNVQDVNQAMLGEQSTVDQTVDAETSKFDELKNKIAVDIPAAITTKNEAFKEEQGIVEGVIQAEIDKLSQLEGALDGIANAAKNKSEAFRSSEKTSGDQSNQTGEKKTKEKSKEQIRDEYDAQLIKDYNVALAEYIKLEQQRVSLVKQGNVTLSDQQMASQAAAFGKMASIQEEWNKETEHSNKLQEEFNSLLQKRSSEEQRLNTEYVSNFNAKLKKDIKYSGRMTTYNTLLNEQALRPDAFSGAMEEMKKKAEELQSYFPINPTDDASIKRVHELSDEMEQMAKEIRSNPEYKNATDTAQAALSKKAETWAAKNTAAINADPEGFERIRQAIRDINTLSEQNEASNMLDQFIAKSNEAGKAGMSFVDVVKKRFVSLGAYLASFASFYRIIGWAKQAIQVVTELDTAMMELKKVSNESAKSYSDFLKGSFDQADVVGGNAKQIIESTAAWKRLGKSFEESQEAAQASVKLLNVSEFDNIDDATTSLISMRQAFKDNTYDDFIDKLNGVGDSFSSSTDQIAYGMRNISAVLKVAGNDIDQSIALLTAANDITQDMSKASMGVRTIALRISGTQEAKQELEDLGEDVSDFVVQTQSKVDAQVRKFTATAANPNGISVLDETGRLRDTYDILLDISRVYQDIVDKDNQMGTNTSNALLELLAGKTRSNILASILQNPDLLEQAYETSKNSQGVGQRELDIYLDSIQAKVTQLQNRIQELTSTVISSDFIKDIVSGLTKVLELVNSIVKVFGTFPTILGSVAGVLLQKNGMGFFNFDKLSKTWSIGFSKVFEKISTHIKFPDKAMENIFKQMDPNKVYSTQLSKIAAEGTVIPQEMYNTEKIEGYTAAVTTAGQAQEAFGVKTQGAAGLLANLGNVATTVGATLLTMGASMILMWGVGKVVGAITSGIDAMLHAKENAIKVAKEAQTEIDDIVEKNKSKEEFQDSEKYERAIKLSSKVTISDGSYKNISATNEEYEEYISLCNEIAGIYPTVVSSYDAQGNAIINLGDNAKDAKEQLDALYESSQRNKNNELKGTVNEAWKGNKQLLSDAQDKVDAAQQAVDNNQAAIDLFTDVDNTLVSQLEKLGTQRSVDIDFGSISSEEAYSLMNGLIDARDKAGISNLLDISSYSEGLITVSAIGDISSDQLTAFYDQIAIDIPEAASNAESAIVDSNGDLEGAIAERDKILQQQLSDEYELLSSSDKFTKTLKGEDSIQQAIKDNFFSLTVDDLPDTDDFEQWAIDNYIEPITYAFTSSEGDGAKKAMKNLFAEGLGDMTASDYDKYLKSNLDIIKEFYTSIGKEDLYKSFVENFNFGRVTVAGGVMANNSKSIIRELIEQFPSETDYIESLSTTLTLDQLIKVKDFVNDDSFAGTIVDAVKKATAKVKEILPSDTFTDILNDETYKDNTEGYESKLSSLSSALEKIRSEGSFTAEEMVKLQESFPDLTEFTAESIQTKAFEELDKWISEIQNHMDGLSPEGLKQVQKYIENLVNQYGDLGVTIEQIHDTFIDSLGININTTAGHEQAKGELALFDAQVEQLRTDLAAEGLELDTHVLYTLVASDQFSGTAEEILAKYKDIAIPWKLTLENEQFEKDIARYQATISKESSERSLKEAGGGILNPEDYKDSILAAKSTSRAREKEYENAIKKRDEYEVGTDNWKAENQNVLDAEKAYYDAQTEERQLEKEGIESATNLLKSQIEVQDNAVTDAQNAIAEAEAKYGEGMADVSLYDTLSKALKKRGNLQSDLSDLWVTLANNHPEYFDEFMANALSAASSSQSDKAEAKANKNKDIQQNLNELQEDATKIQRNLTVAEQKHQKVSKDTYRELINNARAQIKYLKEEQDKVKDNLSEWRNYQDQIDSLSDSIYDWSSTLDTLVYDQASQLASTISTAMSESFSETGLTTDTINALLTSFSDLTGKNLDVSDAFYNTADGVKVNTQALQELTEAEFDLQAASITSEIERTQTALDQNPGDSALQQKLQKLMQTQAQYFAQYEEMQKALSYNNAIDLAEGTENAGANYDKNYGRVKTYKEAREKGLIGTDDFKAWTSYLDVYGRDTIEAYDAVSSKIDRYFTEDASDGLTNFLTDMEKLGYAAQDADGYWTLAVDDYDAAAKDMQMGSEWFMDTLTKLEDFGMVHTYVSSLTEAQLKAQDAEEQIAEAMQTYGEMVRRGASEEDLQAQIDHIHELEDAWNDVNTVRETWSETSEASKRADFLGLEDQLAAAQKMYEQADTDAGRKAAKELAQSYVDQWNYTLGEGADEGIFKLSEASAADYIKRTSITGDSFDQIRDSIGETMSKLGEGGNVNLLARPFVDAARLVEAGWEDAGDGIATVFSSTFSTEDEKLAMNFTPILPDGTVMEKGEFEQYCQDVVNGVRTDDMNLQIGAEFTGDDAIEKAVADAERIHELQDEYYFGIDDFKQYYQNNTEQANEYLSVLSKVPTETLEKISLSNGGYEVDKDIEDSFQGLADALGYTNENAYQLLDILGLIGESVKLPSQYEELENLLSTTTKGSGAGYQISTDLASQSLDSLNTQMEEIGTLKVQLDPNSEVYSQLEQLEQDTQLEIDARLQQDITNSGVSTTQYKAWAAAGDNESIAKSLGIEVDSSELDQYLQQINSMPDSFDMAVHIDDEQFTQLVSAITDPWSMLITADTSEAEQQTEEFKEQTEKKPIIQTIQQKIQSFGNAVAGFFGGGQKAEATAEIDTSGIKKGVQQAEKATENVSKAKGTATADINIAPALMKISALKAALASIASVRPMPIIDQTSISNAIVRTQTLINKLNEAAAKKNSVALGTAHALGTLSRAYSSGSQDWTVGRNESALVNEIGQESRVRDGVWELIPGGPHVEDLRKDDIIFNAQQTADLIRTGRTARSGKLVAHANGTVPGMSAYNKKTSGVAGVTINKKSSNSNNKSNGKGGKNNSGNNKNGKSNSQNQFEKWLEKLFDWIEVRLDRIQRAIDNATQQAENEINYIKKNDFINIAMSQTKSLISNNQAGQKRYQQQANAVLNQAVKTKQISKASADRIQKDMASGKIDISQYDEKTRKVIDAYKTWYEKALDCRDAVYKLQQQVKELQQTKLDNIVDQFETITGLADAVKSSSEATVDYYTTVGRAVNTVDKTQLEAQKGRQDYITEQLKEEAKAYYGEMMKAQVEFGKSSNEYRNAQIKLEEINKSLIESQKEQQELRRAIRDLSSTVRGYFIDRVKALVDKLGTIQSLAEKRGTNNVLGYSVTENPYFEQTKHNNELILKYYEDIQDKQNIIKEFGYEVNSEKYHELYKQITEDESAIISLLSTNEDLKESIRTLRWKPYEEFQEKLNTINSDLQHLQSFIRDGEILDDDGQFTQRGFAQIALIGEQMDLYEKKIGNAEKAIEKLNEEREKGLINEEKYNEELDAQIDIIQDASSALFDSQTKLADMYIDQITAENDALQDLISARKEALNAKKEYYDWDKTLRNKNKDIAQLQAQINALNGVTTDSGKARRAKLQAQLQEKQEDLRDTLYQHSIEVQQEGYDKLSTDMQESLDKTVKLINGDQKILQETASNILQTLQTNSINEAEVIQSIIDDNATRVHESTESVINALKEEGGVESLLSNIGVNSEQNTLNIKEAVDNIKNFTADSSITQLSTDIITTLNSNSQDISGKLSQIESAILSNSVTNTGTAEGGANVAGSVASTPGVTTTNSMGLDSNKTSTVKASTPAKTTTTAKTTAAKTTTAKKSDPIKDLLVSGKARSKNLTSNEKKKKSNLWQYIVKKYGHDWSDALTKKLASLLKISVSKTPTQAQKTKILNALKKKGYASGTKRVPEDLLAWTNEDWDKYGSEIIVRPEDNAILTPLKANDSVIPANLADNLFKWGAISPDKFITNPFVGKWGEGVGGSSVNNDDSYIGGQTVEMHFDSLFHIEGNVDESVMPRLENLGKSLVNDRDFQKNVIKFVTKDFVRESKKQGIR